MQDVAKCFRRKRHSTSDGVPATLNKALWRSFSVQNLSGAASPQASVSACEKWADYQLTLSPRESIWGVPVQRRSQARRCSGPPCPCRRLSTGLGAAARDRVSSASRGRREGAGRALRPLPPGCRRHRRHHPLAASAWRGGGGGGGAAGLRALAPPPAGHSDSFASLKSIGRRGRKRWV